MQRVKEIEPSVEEMMKEEKQSPSCLDCLVTVKRTLTSTGARISAQVKEKPHLEAESLSGSELKTHPEIRPVKEEVTLENWDMPVGDVRAGKSELKEEPLEFGADEKVDRTGRFDVEREALEKKSAEITTISDEEKVKVKPQNDQQIVPWGMSYAGPSLKDPEGYRGRGHVGGERKKEELNRVDAIEAVPFSRAKPRLTHEGHDPSFGRYDQKPTSVKKAVEDRCLSCAVIEDGDFDVEPDWLFVGGEVVNGLSTTKGRKLVDNEIVHFKFSMTTSYRNNAQWIVRFSTKRHGEIGRLPMEWAKCVIPMVRSTKVKVLGRCVTAPENLQMMQEVIVYVSFYIHCSILRERVTSSWRLDGPSNIDSTIYPLLNLFKLLNIKPYQKAEFTPEELDSRKRLLNLNGDANVAVSALPASKRIKGTQQYSSAPKQDDEQSISESSLNKIVGAAEVYDLEEKEPPRTLTRAPSIYVNIFSGEATTQFPTAMQMARGGILADAMGLGKTDMTIALILSRPGRGSSEYQRAGPRRGKGSTLIICPMALLSQWKDGQESIFHRVEWYRVVLDEAHTIKSSKTQVAQAAFTLLSHCRWCLTGTPLQNNLEDLYSLLCFLHVEPWCNWAW
ncbi:hypothetical protein CRG98_035483 [Punica granatum]|uniref:Helicase ATP-binding domain-containing protein n=1 Tax=Punica granatum TaxID=22663 RepID=A0A2I0IJD6_PUNGR|nr:hypothetical protein CRG98_035483 [Punica granatum]